MQELDSKHITSIIIIYYTVDIFLLPYWFLRLRIFWKGSISYFKLPAINFIAEYERRVRSDGALISGTQTRRPTVVCRHDLRHFPFSRSQRYGFFFFWYAVFAIPIGRYLRKGDVACGICLLPTRGNCKYLDRTCVVPFVACQLRFGSCVFFAGSRFVSHWSAVSQKIPRRSYDAASTKAFLWDYY